MGIKIADNYESEGNYVTKESTALKVVKSAASALDKLIENKEINAAEVMNWCNAINSKAPQELGHFVEIYKGDHQNEKETLVSKVVHLTMMIKIKKNSGVYDHSLVGGFHLYLKVLDPQPKKPYTLIPYMISYKSKLDAVGYPIFEIKNAEPVDSDYSG